MAVNGVGASDTTRTEQMRSDRRVEEQRTRDTDQAMESREVHRAPEAGRGENMDVTA